jgi:hypothetical protein
MPALRGNVDSETDEERRWSEVRGTFNLHFHTDLDKVLIEMVTAGYPDKSGLIQAIQIFEGDADHRAEKEAFYQAWRLYHDTVADNGQAIAEAFVRTWPPVSPREHASNLQGVAEILRELGRAEVASEFIDTWVAQHYGARTGSGAHEHYMLSRVSDTEILGKIRQGQEDQNSLLPLAEAFVLMAEGQTYNNQAITSIAAASVDDLIQVIFDHPHEHISRTLRDLISLTENPSQPAWQPAGAKTREACTRIAASSPISGRRMKHWLSIDASSSSVGDPSATQLD